jgi:zeaxanthin glucosyltransferase
LIQKFDKKGQVIEEINYGKAKLKTELYQRLVDETSKHKQIPNHKVIYCAFRTLSRQNFRVIIDFIQTLYKVFENDPNLFLVISNNGVDMKIPAHKNIKIMGYLPQIDFLKYADLMITHGGLGTIKECYDANVPMLVVPINKAVDQNGNGVRVEVNGYGLLADLKKETYLSLKLKKKDLQIKNK